MLLFPNVPYVLTIATLLVLYSLEVKTHKNNTEREVEDVHTGAMTQYLKTKNKSSVFVESISLPRMEFPPYNV